MNGGISHEGYARLPEDLLQELLAGAGGMVEEAQDLLAPALDRREELRKGLDDLGLVRRYADVPTDTLSGIDGGFAVERTAAVDLILSVAVGVEGLAQTTTEWDGTQYEWFSRVALHDPENERLARGVMVAQELAILRRAPHALRILDGSHLTLVIQLNTALTAFSSQVRSEARRVWERLGTVEALRVASTEPSIIAVPKYDSSRDIVEQLGAHLGDDIHGDDKYLMTLLLEPGEFTAPLQVPERPWRQLHFDAREQSDEDLRDALEESIAPLKARELAFTYFKPDIFSPAFRVELKRSLSDGDLDRICSTLARQMTGPFVREPYPQYLADVMAKSVGLGLSALQSAVQLGLTGLGRPEIAEFLIRSYRTEGV